MKIEPSTLTDKENKTTIKITLEGGEAEEYLILIGGRIDWNYPGGAAFIPKPKKEPWFIHDKDRKTTEQKLEILIKDIQEATGLQNINFYEGIDIECWMANDPILKGRFCLFGILGSDNEDLRNIRNQTRKSKPRHEVKLTRSSAGGSLMRKTTIDEPATRMPKTAPKMPQDARKGTKPVKYTGKEK